MRPTVLEISALRITRDGTRILRDVNWTIRRGEHWVILGANGSGKTSLLRSVTGYLMPTGGEITLLGRRYGESDWRELRKKVGLVSSALRQMMADDEPALASVISGKTATIDFRARPSRGDCRRARQLLRAVECTRLADRAWRVLSQGERQRVLIARALMAQPEVLILDEPCAGLDPAAREHFLQFLQRLGRRANSPTFIFVTHHVEEIVPAFTHVLVLKRGGVLDAGPKRRVVTSATLSVAFAACVRVTRYCGRFVLQVRPKRGTVI